MKAIPYGLGKRIKSHCSNQNTAAKRYKDLEEHLCARKHNRKKVHYSIGRAMRDDVNTAKEKKKQNDSRAHLIIRYHPGLPDINGILRQLHPILESDPRLKNIFDKPPILAFKRQKNLREIVVKSRLPNVTENNSDNRKDKYGPCRANGGRADCKLCIALPEQTSITSHADGKVHRLFCGKNADCRSKNVVYCLSCNLCGIQYVGQTTDLRKRTNNHRSCIF